MQFPHAYLFIKNEGKALNYKWLKGLANNVPIYISKQSRRNVPMERICAVMREASSILLDTHLCNDISAVAISCTSINDLLLIANSGKLVATCWLDKEEDIEKVIELVNGYHLANQVSFAACELLENYEQAHASVKNYLSSKPFSDDDLLRHVGVLASRDTELQDAIRLALKSSIRKGIVNRIDLQ